MTRHLLVTGVAALALAVAGCGGSDESSSTSPTDEWASGFCTAITTWKDSVTSITEQFSNPSSLSSDGLKDAANDVSSATQTLTDDLKGLGTPDTESGEEVKTSIDDLSTTVESEVADIESAADGVSGLSDLPNAITSITASLSAMSNAFASALQSVESADVSGELQTALEDSPECANISG